MADPAPIGSAAAQGVQGGVTGTTAEGSDPSTMTPAQLVAYYDGLLTKLQTDEIALQGTLAARQADLVGLGNIDQNAPNAPSPQQIQTRADALTSMINDAQRQLDENNRRQSVAQGQFSRAVDSAQKASGQPLTPKEQAVLDQQAAELQSRIEGNNADRALREAQLKADQAKNALASDPANVKAQRDADAADKALKDATAAHYAAADKSQQAQDALNANKDARDELLAPYERDKVAADTANTKAGTDRIYQLLPGEVKIQEANYKAALMAAGLDEQRAAEIAANLAAGIPASTAAANNAQAASNTANAAATNLKTQQDTVGAYRTMRDQIAEGIKNGTMSSQEGDDLMFKQRFGATPYDIWKAQTDDATTLSNNLLQAGAYVRPGQTSLDPSGAVAGLLGQLGIKTPDLSLSPQSMPQFAQSVLGQMPSPQNSPTFNPDGSTAGPWANGAPAQGVLQFPGQGSQAYEAWVAQQVAAGNGAQPGAASDPNVPPTQAQGPVTNPGASGQQIDMGQGPPNAPTPPQTGTTTITINTGNGTTNTQPTQPAPAKPVTGPAPAAPWNDPSQQYAPPQPPIPQQGRPPAPPVPPASPWPDPREQYGAMGQPGRWAA